MIGNYLYGEFSVKYDMFAILFDMFVLMYNKFVIMNGQFVFYNGKFVIFLSKFCIKRVADAYITFKITGQVTSATPPTGTPATSSARNLLPRYLTRSPRGRLRSDACGCSLVSLFSRSVLGLFNSCRFHLHVSGTRCAREQSSSLGGGIASPDTMMVHKRCKGRPTCPLNLFASHLTSTNVSFAGGVD